MDIFGRNKAKTKPAKKILDLSIKDDEIMGEGIRIDPEYVKIIQARQEAELKQTTDVLTDAFEKAGMLPDGGRKHVSYADDFSETVYGSRKTVGRVTIAQRIGNGVRGAFVAMTEALQEASAAELPTEVPFAALTRTVRRFNSI